MASTYPNFDGTQACLRPTTEQAAGFDAVVGADPVPALQVCGTCRFMAACRTYALSDPALVGVWGGTTDEDRDSARRRASRAAS